MPSADYTILQRSNPLAVERLLRALPDWFGIEHALREYVEDARTKPTYLAVNSATTEVIGALLVTRHFPESAEMHVLAVDPRHHRREIGTALAQQFEDDMRADGARLLEVKTLGPSRRVESYAKTRAFYRAVGICRSRNCGAFGQRTRPSSS
jgi:ribosomal protein S18 acetylase RimI-like enzyme